MAFRGLAKTRRFSGRSERRLGVPGFPTEPCPLDVIGLCGQQSRTAALNQGTRGFRFWEPRDTIGTTEKSPVYLIIPAARVTNEQVLIDLA